MTNLELFLSDHRGGTIETLVEEATRAGIWGEDHFDDLIFKAKAADIRRAIKSFKDKDGFPTWGNVKHQISEDETEQVYKPIALFDVDEYKQVILYHIDRGQYHFKNAQHLIRRCAAERGVQLKFDIGPFAN